MAKVDVDVVRRVLQRNDVDGDVIAQVLEDLEMEVSSDGDGKPELPPPVKKQFVILVSDPDGKFQEDLFTGWVLQIPENQSPMEIGARLIRAAHDFNQSKKGARDPAKSITDVCEIVPAKVLRNQQVWVRTKEPVLLIRTDNRIPSLPVDGMA
ncbi:MAG: hypothetical protein LBP65_03485 [Puniceicoccales bacterium]|jgi:hypothetical protein|nr:hypothetical protein [Puniceicoccales bacterium]